MEAEIVDTSGLLLVAKEKELIDKLTAQVEKDFAMANVSLNLPVVFNAKDFVSNIRERVYRLMVEQFSEYLNLLYVVDVPEKEFKHIQVTEAAEVADRVTFLILKREFQKVLFKTMYR
ncbi:hypothetical protein [Maribacter thermophilus]|uniref:hypothetical protein n=1 Tax=Maribacter thermophilus TaxID=1197874 RepID=UPI000641519F|nr:hypothetical protein [Maribacter thermophilus]